MVATNNDDGCQLTARMMMAAARSRSDPVTSDPLDSEGKADCA